MKNRPPTDTSKTNVYYSIFRQRAVRKPSIKARERKDKNYDNTGTGNNYNGTVPANPIRKETGQP
jgi:hypothetical protein